MKVKDESSEYDDTKKKSMNKRKRDEAMLQYEELDEETIEQMKRDAELLLHLNESSNKWASTSKDEDSGKIK